MPSIKIDLDILEQLTERIEDVVLRFEKLESSLSTPKFYTVEDVAKMTGWCVATVRNMFNRADFPSCTFGKEKLVETSALKEYFRLPRRA